MSKIKKSETSLLRLKNFIFGKDNIKDLSHIDDIIDFISDDVVNKNSSRFSELIQRQFADGVEYMGGINKVGLGDLQTKEHADRLDRYNGANEITDSIPYCNKALKVISNNITSPDDITKNSLHILSTDDSNERTNREVSDLKNLYKMINLEDCVEDLITDLLKYGDQFVEICDVDDKNIPLTQTLLAEGGNNSYIDEYEFTVVDVNTDDYGEYKNTNTTKKIRFTLTENSSSDESKNIDKLGINVERIKLLVHDPRNVIKLQSKRYRTCLGYLVLPYTASNESDNIGAMKNIIMKSGTANTIDKIYEDLLNNIGKYISQNDELLHNKTEFKNFIIKALIDIKDQRDGVLNIRFVPAYKMEHFAFANKRYFPYGEGIFNKVMFSAKLLITMQTALVVKRLSDATEKRIIYIESGIPRNLTNTINDIKEAHRKRKHSIDTLGNIASIPSKITLFEDIYIPQSRGKRFVEFDRLERQTDVRDMTDELKYLRDTIVAELDVPPSFISIEENIGNKSTLSYESVLFARTIINYQKRISPHFKSLLKKVYKLVYDKNLSDDIIITLPTPRMLQVQLESEHMDYIQRVLDVYNQLEIPKEYLVKKYLPNINFDEVKEFKTKNKIDKKLLPNDKEEETGGYGGF